MSSDVQQFVIAAQDSASSTIGKVSRELKGLGGAAGGVAGPMGKLSAVTGGLISPMTLGIGAVAGLGAALGDSVGRLMNVEKLTAQTGAVIKSTGGAAHVSAAHVSGLANSIEGLTSVDMEQISAGENMLLTFTNVQNKVGAGNNIFDRATTAITDMSVALGEDTSAAAVQLGKALSDPIAGVTALRKVGVTFNQAQKDQIASFVRANDLMAAQKVILLRS